MQAIAATKRGDRFLIAQYFIRVFALVHFFNFLNLVLHAGKLFGSNGLIPVNKYIATIKSNGGTIWDALSLFYFFPNDTMVWTLSIAGLLMSLLCIAGWQSRWMFAGMFLVYFNFLETGQMLYSFQWDNLILETTFLAIWLPNSGHFFSNMKKGPDRLLSWLFLWLLFRLYLESGVAKIFWGPESWATLKAMSHYYETAPLPTIFSYYAHFLPESWHQFETGITLVIEILLPVMFFWGKTARRMAFLLFSFFQLVILLTGNYGIFNYNTLCLHLFLLKDADLKAIGKKIKWPFWADITIVKSTPPVRYMYIVAGIVVLFSIIEFMMFAGGRGVQGTTLQKIQNYTGKTKIASRYHLFGPIDPIRYELEIEASVDGKDWKQLQFPYKIDRVTDPPRFVAPFHPRVDFRLWFERYPVRWDEGSLPYPDITAHPRVLSPYLTRLAEQIPSNYSLALRHFENDPFENKTPNYVRIGYYHYQMLNPDRSKKGVYWKKSKVGMVYINPKLIQNGQPRMIQGVELD